MYIQVHEPIHKKTQVTSQFIKSLGKSLNEGEKGIYLKRKKNPPNIKQTYKHTKNSYKRTKNHPTVLEMNGLFLTYESIKIHKILPMKITA